MESSNGGIISTGGPLKAGGGSSSPKSGNTSEDAEDVDGDSYEDEEDELHGVLKKCHAGDITAEEAHEHITKMMKGDAEEDGEDKNVKRHSGVKATQEMRGQFTKDKSAANVKRPQPQRGVEGVKRDTAKYQQGM